MPNYTEIEVETTEALYTVEGLVTCKEDGSPKVKITSVLATVGDKKTVWFDKEETAKILAIHGATWKKLLAEKAEDEAVSGAEQRYEMALEDR